MMKQAAALRGKKVVVLICGGNVSRDTLKRII
jgi:threonine dehydratase